MSTAVQLVFACLGYSIKSIFPEAITFLAIMLKKKEPFPLLMNGCGVTQHISFNLSCENALKMENSLYSSCDIAAQTNKLLRTHCI